MKYRKKPVVIEAWRASAGLMPEWVAQAIHLRKIMPLVPGDGYAIDTLEGRMHATENDWIIRGVKGELYPCRPDIFAATYEPVE